MCHQPALESKCHVLNMGGSIPMTVLKRETASLTPTVVMPLERSKMSSGEDGLPPLTMGMLLPLFWSGRATKYGARR